MNVSHKFAREANLKFLQALASILQLRLCFEIKVLGIF